MRVTLGARRLLAATCRKCGALLPGSAFAFRVRNMRDRHAYIDQRCGNCRFGHKVKGKRQP